MKKDLESVRNVRLDELKEYILSFDISHVDEILQCWSMKSLLKKVSFQKELYEQALNRLYLSKNYEQMEYHLNMMNHLFHHFEYQQVKRDLLSKLLSRYVGLDEYLVIRQLVDFQEISFEVFIGKLYNQHTELMDLVKICLIEDEYEQAYLYLKQMDYCEEEAVLDLICQYSPLSYYKLKLNYYSKQKQSFLFQAMN